MCGLCTTVCVDRVSDCKQWAAKGDCKRNKDYMIQHCPQSCDVCPKLQLFAKHDKSEL